MRRVDLTEFDAFGGKDVHGAFTERAPRLRIDFDILHLFHLCPLMLGEFGLACKFRHAGGAIGDAAAIQPPLPHVA